MTTLSSANWTSAVFEETTGGLLGPIKVFIEYASVLIELVAVVIIVAATLVATASYTRKLLARRGDRNANLRYYEQYKVRLGRALLLGLEVLVAADIVRTVALEPSLTNVAILAVLVLVRTFLSWSLVVEIEHRWPWQERTHAHREAAAAIEEAK